MKYIWIVLFFLFACSSVGAAFAGETYYVFEDSRGKTVMQDRVPPELKHRGYKMVNSNGITLQVVPPTRKERRKPVFASNELQPDDLRLLQSYSSVHDIESARDNRLSHLQEIINSTEEHTQAFERNLNSMKQRKDHEEAAGRSADKKLLKDIATVESLITKNRQYLERKRTEHTELSANYQRDIDRFSHIRRQSGK